jgi:hypothetical protein
MSNLPSFVHFTSSGVRAQHRLPVASRQHRRQHGVRVLLPEELGDDDARRNARRAFRADGSAPKSAAMWSESVRPGRSCCRLQARSNARP